MKLQATEFVYNADGKADIGFIAEDVALIDPRLVSYTDEGKPWSLQLHGILAVVTKSVQEIVKRQDDQEERIAELEARLEALEAKREYSCRIK